jgi:hypothetical protein
MPANCWQLTSKMIQKAATARFDGLGRGLDRITKATALVGAGPNQVSPPAKIHPEDCARHGSRTTQDVRTPIRRRPETPGRNKTRDPFGLLISAGLAVEVMRRAEFAQ